MYDSEVMCRKKMDSHWSIYRDYTVYFFRKRPLTLTLALPCRWYIIFLQEHFIIYLMIYNLIFNYNEICNLFILKNSKFLEKILKITKSKILWGSVKTERSIFVKNQSQVFPSHKKGEKKASYTFRITRTLEKKIFFFNFLVKCCCS